MPDHRVLRRQSDVGGQRTPLERATSLRIAASVRAKFDSARQCKEELSNWPAVLLRLGLSQLGWSHGVFTISTRAGVTLRAPNHPLSRWPPVEILVEDSYRLRDLSWENPLAARAVLDIGAHVGSFTCALAARLPGASFTCVEPLPSTLPFLRANLARNGLALKAAVLPAAVAEADGEAELWASDDASSEASLEAQLWASWHVSSHARESKVTVQTMSFDSIVAAAGGRTDIVKLDCEGGEYAAVLESSSGAWATVAQLFLEYHPVAARDFEDLRERLSELGLHLVWQNPSPRPGAGMAYFVRGGWSGVEYKHQ